jgi:hypothetical protein
MKVLIISTSKTGGGKERTTAYKNFLESKNHTVKIIQFPSSDISNKLWYYYLRSRANISGHEKWHMEKTANRLEKIIKQCRYDVVIGVETPLSYVLTRELSCLKIFSCESVESDELYFSKNFEDLSRFHQLRDMEIDIIKKSDYVVFPWKTTEDYVRKYLWNGDNFVTIKYGCYPKEKTVSYSHPVSIVSLGSLRTYWSNKELMSYLTRVSPYLIDVYGKYRPHKKYNLNYKGFAPSQNVLYNYQFGLNTISKDLYRKNHHSSRIMSYLACGLPVLSPDWMKFSNQIKGVLPFNEDNFVEILDKYSGPEEWQKISNDAYKQALELDWKKVLQPLEELVEK